MKNTPFEAIQVTAEGKDVHKIGSVLWSNVELKFELSVILIPPFRCCLLNRSVSYYSCIDLVNMSSQMKQDGING